MEDEKDKLLREDIIKMLNTDNALIKKHLKEAIELIIQLDDDKNYILSDLERYKFSKILERLNDKW